MYNNVGMHIISSLQGVQEAGCADLPGFRSRLSGTYRKE